MVRQNEQQSNLKRRSFLSIIVGVILSPLMPALSFARRLWPVRSVEKSVPEFDPASWRLTVAGKVDYPIELTYDSLKQLPSVQQVNDLDCVEQWSVKKITWRGVQLRTIIEMSKPQPDARYLIIYCSGGQYTESLTIEQALSPDVILAYEADNKPLEPKHGAPLRLVVPRLWAYKSAKWVERIEFASERHLGYWEQRGYDPDAGPEKYHGKGKKARPGKQL
ncbi:MAG: molybdopterin-dependent oxidoreductase [candidate division KSB1 bacterium]|nr:molybdopterin-dependent oxidoreductase [candidate division KSB1 bacterium]MDZ7334335.1 molybdopterin-dependent oxidoreductase [candidate division KSB1 bacterium]MDZ7356376.1 molybdopterin-dependent oxidoreductase [candidate division KSB1 bacterium]MDZ7399316.1 molybdopterin-dependent oxidoreductase [candidate division KSB1 bacterium]